MKSKVILACIVALSFCLVLALIGCSSSTTPGTAMPPHEDSGNVQTGVDVQIDWVDFICFDNITYVRNTTVSESAGLQQHLGSEYAVVTFNVAQNVKELDYSVKHGDAGFLQEGTAIYTLSDYSPSFRLVAFVHNQLLLYEADTNPNAEYGRDLLDIADKVECIGINSIQDGVTEIAEIEAPEKVATLVDMALEAPVTLLSPDFNPACFVVFHLNDGTSVIRAFDIHAGLLQRGIQVPNEFSDVIRNTIEYSM